MVGETVRSRRALLRLATARWEAEDVAPFAARWLHGRELRDAAELVKLAGELRGRPEVLTGPYEGFLGWDGERFLVELLECEHAGEEGSAGAFLPAVFKLAVGAWVMEYGLTADGRGRLPPGGLAGAYVEVLRGFYWAWGPLFAEPRLPLAEVRRRLLLLAWLYLFWGAVQPGGAELERVREELWQRYGQGLGADAAGGVRLVPKVEGSRWTLRLVCPRLSRHAFRENVEGRVVLPLVADLLGKGLVYGFERYGRSGGNGYRLVARPRDLYTRAVVELVFPRLVPRPCACGCGNAAAPGSKWAAPSHARRVRRREGKTAREDAKAYWRVQLNRGKITEEEYEKVVAAVDRLWGEGVRDRRELELRAGEVAGVDPGVYARLRAKR